MKIITDSAGQNAIESLCHSALVHCPREAFIVNLTFVTSVLSSIEIEKEEVPEQPPKP